MNIGPSYASQDGTLSATVTASADVAVIQTQGFGVLAVSLVVGVANLSAFTVEGRVSQDGGWFTVASAAADFTTPNAPILDASGSLVTAAFGATVHWFKMDVLGLEAVRLKAAGTASTIAGHYGLV